MQAVKASRLCIVVFVTCTTKETFLVGRAYVEFNSLAKPVAETSTVLVQVVRTCWTRV